MLKFINEGNLQAAAAQFGNWVYVNGQVSQGLVRRRAAEKALFLTPG
jgi:lysozyme